MEMFDDGRGLVHQAHALPAQPPAEVEVLVVEDEIGIEPARGEEELALERDVRRIEPRPAGLAIGLALEAAIVEQGA